MKLKASFSLFLVAQSATASVVTPPGEYRGITLFRRECAVDQNIKCEDDGFNRLKIVSRRDLDPNRVFHLTPADIERATRFQSDQQMKLKAAKTGGPTAGEQANDHIAEMEFQRNTIAFLQYSCMGLSGTCLYLGSKLAKVSPWSIVVYGACLTAGNSCNTYGNDATKRYDEEIKQVKEACKEGADPAACEKRVMKGKNAKLLPADYPSPALGEGSGDSGTIGGSPEVWTTPGMVCVNNTIIMEGGPMGEKIAVPETNCYVL